MDAECALSGCETTKATQSSSSRKLSWIAPHESTQTQTQTQTNTAASSGKENVRSCDGNAALKCTQTESEGMRASCAKSNGAYPSVAAMHSEHVMMADRDDALASSLCMSKRLPCAVTAEN